MQTQLKPTKRLLWHYFHTQFRLFYVLLFIGFPLSSLLAQSDGLPRGAYQMPYIRYEAEEASYNGVLYESPQFDQSLTASEASNQKYVGLVGAGNSVTFSLTEAGQGVTLRFTMPDASSGDGLNGSLIIRVNGQFNQTIDVSSYWAYQYLATGSIHPSNNPGAGNKVRMRFDEVHFNLGQSYSSGSSITIESPGGVEYGIDFIEVEPIPDPIQKPAGYISITDAPYNAVPNDGNDDLPALESAMAAAESSGTGVYIPSGQWDLDYRWIVPESNVTVTGAGIWHTTLYFMNNAQFGGGIYGDGATNITMGNFYINTINNDRMDYGEEPSEAPGTPYKIYKAFMGTFAQSYIHDVWQEHFEVGIWMGDYDHSPRNIADGTTFTRIRIRNNYADGCNFANGSSNCVLEHSNVRNGGDDGMAVWPDGSGTTVFATNNIFRYNTVEHIYRAGGAALFGGVSHEIHHCIIKDGFAGSGIRLTTDFSAPESPKFSNSGLHRIYENTIISCGTSYDLWDRKRGSIEINTPQGLNNVLFENIDIFNSQRHGIQIEGQGFNNVNFNNITVDGTGKDPVVRDIGGDVYGGLAMMVQANSGTITVNKIAMSDIESVNEDGNKDILNRNTGFDLQIIDADIELTSLDLSAGDTDILVGQSQAVALGFTPSNATNKSVTWSNSNPGVISFDEQSMQVTGVGTGNAVLTATSQENGGINDNITFNVSAAVNLTTLDASASENGDNGAFQVTISDISQSITVGYLLSGSAVSDIDFTGSPILNGSVTLTPSNPSQIITISAIDDSEFEGPEDLIMTLLAGTGYQLGGSTSGVITIADNENPPCVSPVIGLTANAPANNSTIESSWNEVPATGISNVTIGGIPGDYSGQWRAMYDAQALYVLVEVDDNDLNNDSGGEWWNDDVINIFIDGDNSKGSSYDGINDFQLGFRWNDSGINVGGNSVNNTTGVNFTLFATSSGYGLKVAIPWSTIGISPSVGYTLGFDVAVDDDDNGGARDSQISSFATSDAGWTNPGLFGSVYLTTCEAITPTTPVITSPLSITRLDGESINYTITASNFPETFAASNLPQGISLNTSTGVLSGVLNDIGTTNISISASNSAGTDTENLMLTVNAVDVTGISVTPTNSTIQTSGTVQLTAAISPGNASDQSVSWTSSNTSIATVDSNGMVTGVSSGNTTITATTNDGGFTAISSIQVTAPGELPPQAIVTSSSITLPVNGTQVDGSASSDPDGSITSYNWTQISGPNTATLTGQNTAVLGVSNLIEGSYQFELIVTDNNGNTDIAIASVTVNPESVIPADRGYYDAPYVRYEAGANSLGGGAELLTFSMNQADLQFEATDREAVKLNSTGQFVEWTSSNAGQGMVIRFSMPDAPGGGGLNGSLGLYIDGQFYADIPLTSKWSYNYFDNVNSGDPNIPRNDPGTNRTVRMLYDEKRIKLDTEYPSGTTFRLERNSSSGGIDYYIVDFMELEPIPSPVAFNSSTMRSVVEFGATADDGTVDTQAFVNAVNTVRNTGEILYIPEGTFDLNFKWSIGHDVSIQGAGMWYTELHYTQGTPSAGGISADGSNVHLADFYMSTENTIRTADYKGITGSYGANSTVDRVWVVHHETGAWIWQVNGVATSNFVMSHCRLRNNYADGINFSSGTTNSICEHSDMRNNLDDAMASWSPSDGPTASMFNEFRYNTAENTLRAAGVGFFGGGGHKAHHLIVKDNTEAGLRINSDFPGYQFTNDEIEFSNITVIGSGTNANLWWNRYGAIDIFTRLYDITNVRFDNIDIFDSQKDAIFIYTVNPSYSIQNLMLHNITVNGTGLDQNQNNFTSGTYDDYLGYAVLADNQVQAAIDICNLSVSNAASQPDIQLDNPGNININYCNTIDPTGISVNPTALTLNTGESATITAIVTPADATNKSVTWLSSNTSVATVANGVVTAIGDGSTTISASTVNGFTASTAVTVSTSEVLPTSVTMSCPGSIDAGNQFQLSWTVLPANATNQSVTFASSNPSVLSVDANGLLTANSGGSAIITVTTDANGLSDNCQINVIIVQQDPYLGSPVNIPGTIEVENFDTGGEGIAYSDSDTNNNGGQYRTSEGVDIEVCSEGGYNVGWASAGEWLEYTVNVTTAGTYDFEFRVASIFDGGTFHVEFNGSNVTGTVTSVNTGAWQTWASVNVNGVPLNAGQQVMRIALDNPNHNLDKVIITSSGSSNNPPAANAGSDQTLSPGSINTNLDGAGSDPDGDGLSFSWSQISGPSVTINSPSSEDTQVSGLTDGNSYTFRLTVSDGVLSATDDVQVVVQNSGSGGSSFHIRNRWQNTYLYDAGSNVGYSSSAGGSSYEWELEDVGEGYVEIRNVGTGEYMHIENLTGRIQSTSRTFGWYSSRWEIVDVDGTHSRIRNAWQGNQYVHVENLVGEAQYGTIDPSWWSAQWELESTSSSRKDLTNIESRNQDKINIYPNPIIDNVLHISHHSEGESQIEIIDLSGTVVYSIEMEGGQLSIDMTSISNGIYMIKISGIGETFFEKVLKQ